jgi:carboxypeptidase Q
MRLFLSTVGSALALVLAATSVSAQSVDRAQVNRIIDAGMNHSEVMETVSHLSDTIGGRMTNSPQMREAERWTQSQFKAWGLSNVGTEGFDFGRGWSIEQSSVRMITPRVRELRAIPVAWTPATNGAVRAEVIVAPMAKVADFAKWKGKLRGKVVLVTNPGEPKDATTPAFERLTSEELGAYDVYKQPVHKLGEERFFIKSEERQAKLDAFLAEEGAVAWARMAYRDGSLLHGEGYMHKVGQTPKVPGVEIAAEDYRRLARLAKGAQPVSLEVMSAVKFHDEDAKAYNVLAEIPGRDPKAGYVMAGAHLDSWVAGDGAADNGAGSAVVMEAARILASLGIKPKRTIRFALWAGEEQGLYGSQNYVERHLASRGPANDTDPNQREYGVWYNKFPITPKAGYGDMAAYFNLDNGSGKIRGIFVEGNTQVVPIFQEWLAPFASMGASTVAVQPTVGTDHEYFQSIGLPGFQFIQDPLEYENRVHHSNLDTVDHLRPDDLRQAAVIMASFLLLAAERDQPLPRMPIPTKPKVTDTFAYPADEDE